jgi:biotin carboxyl carrier protein
MMAAPAAAPAAAAPAAPAAAPAAAAPKPAAPPVAAALPAGTEVFSPMSGTMYRSPAPGEPPFVREGDRVKKGQAVCIVEAMKLMNEIEVGGGWMRGDLGGRAGTTRLASRRRLSSQAVVTERPPHSSENLTSIHRPAPNQSQTEVGGEVVKILIENGTPVTPGMPIMIIKP